MIKNRPNKHPAKRRAIAIAMAMSAAVTLFPGVSAGGTGSPVYRIAAGKTVFTGSETKLIRVRFDEAVGTDDLHFDVSGDGRVFGFLMRKVGYYGDREGARQEASRPQVWGTVVGQCKTRGCRSHEEVPFISAYNVTRFAGVWDFYFVGDGGKVSVTLTVHGADGTKTIDVDRAGGRVVDHEIRSLKPRVHETERDSIYSAGNFSSLKHLDFGMLGLWVVGDSHAATGYGPCLYYGKDRPADTASAFTPGCPGAELGPLFSGVTTSQGPPYDRGGIVYSVRSAGPPSAPRGIGGWFATASEVKRFGAVALWIDYPDVDTEYR